MAMTFRQLLTAVLTTAGQQTPNQIPATGIITDTYQLQVAELVNQIKDEVEAACQWRAYWTQYNVNYLANVNTQLIKDQITNATPNSNCSVVRMNNPAVGRTIALCFDMTSVGVPFPLIETPIPDLQYITNLTQSTPVQYSTNFAIQDQGNDVVNMLVYPASSTGRTIQVTLYNPQGRLNPALAGTTGGIDTPILIPYRPLLMGSIWQVLEERGEELGQNSMYTESKYRIALDDAISRDTTEMGGLTMMAV